MEGWIGECQKKVTTSSIEENSYYWFSYDRIKKIILVYPIEHLESEQRRRDENKKYMIDNR